MKKNLLLSAIGAWMLSMSGLHAQAVADSLVQRADSIVPAQALPAVADSLAADTLAGMPADTAVAISADTLATLDPASVPADTRAE